MSGLDLRQRETLLKGGSRGPAVIAGDAPRSLLYRSAAHLGEPKMPPGSRRPLPQGDLAILKEWIEAGAPYPEAGAAARRTLLVVDEEAAPPPGAGTG